MGSPRRIETTPLRRPLYKSSYMEAGKKGMEFSRSVLVCGYLEGREDETFPSRGDIQDSKLSAWMSSLIPRWILITL